jgi:hypothetical protein
MFVTLLVTFLIIFLSFRSLDGAELDLGTVDRNTWINVEIPTGDSVQVITLGGNAIDDFIHFATTGANPTTSAWIDVVSMGTAGSNMWKFRDLINDLVPADSLAGQYEVIIRSWTSDAPVNTTINFSLVDSSYNESLRMAKVAADSTTNALKHNAEYSLLRIFNTLDSAIE